ncbi:TLDc domain-containing protein [Entamoeba marina]
MGNVETHHKSLKKGSIGQLTPPATFDTTSPTSPQSPSPRPKTVGKHISLFQKSKSQLNLSLPQSSRDKSDDVKPFYTPRFGHTSKHSFGRHSPQISTEALLLNPPMSPRTKSRTPNFKSPNSGSTSTINYNSGANQSKRSPFGIKKRVQSLDLTNDVKLERQHQERVQLKKMKSVIHKKYHLKNYEVIFNSQRDELTARSLNSKICCKSNIMIVVKATDNRYFACFQQELIPTQPKYQCLKTQSVEFDLFGFKDNFSRPSRKLSPSDSNGIVLYPRNEMGFVMTCHSAFLDHGKWEILYSSSIGENMENLLKKQSVSHHLTVEALYALQWK